jgi:hypothetical protein
VNEPPPPPHDARVDSGNVRWSIAFWVAVSAVSALALVAQVRRWLSNADPQPGWLAGLSPDWLVFLPVLAAAPAAWFARRRLLERPPRWWPHLGRWGGESCPTNIKPTTRHEDLRAFALSLLVAAAGWGMSWSVGANFGELPPAYHDEFSYLFQAQTFLAGRVSFPSHPTMPELFDQMHVLNEGRFAGRYFPGTAIWMTPFVALGNPWWGHHAAHAFASFLLFWIGRHLANNAVGLLAGLLLAFSPGVALFSNLLLAHHPTLVGLLVFAITFLKLRRAIDERTRLWPWAVLTGCGLTYAMLCRPMTAAGFGLPFGLWFGWWMLRGESASTAGRPDTALPQRMLTAAAMALPIVVGLAGLFVYNRAITGDGLLSPYQQYTDIYTPRHVYGFNNVVRGEQHLGPKVLENYDVWAENLTPALAAKNVGRRIMFSQVWTLGIVPLTWAGLVFLLTIDRWSGDWWLMAAAILSLHAVHVPYWFEGIMGWHYVFETAPLWLLIFAGVSQHLWGEWRLAGRPWMPVWWSAVLGTALAVNLITVPPLWPARLDVGIAEVSFSRQRYADFFTHVRELTAGRRALVLVHPDPADRHIDYVVNSPGLDDEVIFGRYRDSETDLQEVAQTFADRDVWLINVADGTVRQISRAGP